LVGLFVGDAKPYIGNSVKDSFEEFGLRIVSRSGLAKIQGMVIAVVIMVAAFAVYYIAMPTPTPKPPTATTTAATEVIPDDIAAIVKQLPTYYPKDYWKTIAAAKQEGKLVIYHSWSAGEIAILLETFQKFYPFIKVEQLRMDSAKAYDKYNAEMTALGRSGCDVLRVDQTVYLGMVRRGEILNYVSPETPYMPKGLYMEGYLYPDILSAAGVMYDSRVLSGKNVAKGAEDFVNIVKSNPDYWKGKVHVSDPRFVGGAWRNYYMLRKYAGKEKTFAMYRALIDNKALLITSSGRAVSAIQAGEILAMWDAGLTSWAAIRFSADNPTYLTWTIWEDYPFIEARVNSVLIKNGGGHPNAAKLWLDFVLSLRGQSGIATYGIPVRTDYAEKGEQTGLIKYWQENVVKTGIFARAYFNSLLPEEAALEYVSVKDDWLTDWEKAMGFK